MTVADDVRPPALGLGLRRLGAIGRARVEAARQPLSPAAALATRYLALLAGLAAWLVCYIFGFSALQEHHDQHNLYAAFRQQLAEATAPIGGAIPEGRPVAVITAAAAGIHRVVVVEGTSASDLQAGPGHLPGTVLPGQPGTATLLGRSTAFGGPFGRLPALQPGDPIAVTTGQGTFHFTVTRIRQPGDAVPAPQPGTSTLTLVTAAHGGWTAGWSPSHAVFVDATLAGNPATAVAASGAPTSADLVMHGDGTALVPLVLWLQALVVVGLAVFWAYAKWGRRQTWLVGIPLATAAMWGASDAVVRLLPNLF
ncbi:MAG TPA: class E sortase [Mycobacteriales bacterium]|nr:class E sortase [Mycobacteriales bacterium]